VSVKPFQPNLQGLPWQPW